MRDTIAKPKKQTKNIYKRKGAAQEKLIKQIMRILHTSYAKFVNKAAGKNCTRSINEDKSFQIAIS